jgi:hypothetical protein
MKFSQKVERIKAPGGDVIKQNKTKQTGLRSIHTTESSDALRFPCLDSVRFARLDPKGFLAEMTDPGRVIANDVFFPAMTSGNVNSDFGNH